MVRYVSRKGSQISEGPLAVSEGASCVPRCRTSVVQPNPTAGERILADRWRRPISKIKIFGKFASPCPIKGLRLP